MMTLSVLTPFARGPSVETTARILPWKSPAPSTCQRSLVPSNETTGYSRLRLTWRRPLGADSKREPIGTLRADASLPSVGRDGVSRPDSICETIDGVSPAFSASCRCWRPRSPLRALIRAPRGGVWPHPAWGQGGWGRDGQGDALDSCQWGRDG